MYPHAYLTPMHTFTFSVMGMENRCLDYNCLSSTIAQLADDTHTLQLVTKYSHLLKCII